MNGIKALGSEIIAFYKAWPVGPDFYHDDGIIYEDEKGHIVGITPTEEYEVAEAFGYFIWQGRGNVPASIEVHGVQIAIPQDWAGPDTEEVFKAWRGDKRPYSVMLSPDQVGEFKRVCAEHGWDLT
jgi:hypothetical protein